MKILFVTNQLDIGGIETNLVRLVRAMTQRGHACTVAARTGTLSVEACDAGAALRAMHMRRLPHHMAADVGRLWWAIRAERPDVVHVFSASAGVLVQLALRLIHPRVRPPVLASVMGLAEAPEEPDAAVRRRVRHTTRGADRVIVMAPAISAFIAAVGVDASRVLNDTVVGVERAEMVTPRERAESKRALSLDIDAPVVTTIGRLEPRKSHHLFIEAAEHVLARRPEVQFVVVGDGDLHTGLRELAARKGLGQSLRFLGSRRDIPLILRATDVYVRPGVVEGFIGITVLEAQAVGIPAVSFNTEDVRLAIDHGRTGLLARNGDPLDLAAQVVRLLEDSDLAAAIGSAGRQQFLETYELEGVVDRLVGHYETLRSASTVAA